MWKLKDRNYMRTLYIMSQVMVVFYAIMHFMCNTSIYADGSEYVRQILVGNTFALIEPGRANVQFLGQFLMVLGLNLGITSLFVLIKLYSLGFVIMNTLFWILTFRLCYRKKESIYLILSIILCCITFTFTGFFVMSESISSVSIFWFVFLSFTLYSIEDTLQHRILVTITSIIACRSYESFAFLGTIILIMIGIKVIKEKIKLEYYIWLNIGIVITGIISSINKILNPRDVSNRTGILYSITQIDIKIMIFCIGIILVLGLTYFLNNKYILQSINIIPKIGFLVSIISLVVIGPNNFFGVGSKKMYLLIPLSILILSIVLSKFIFEVVHKDRVLNLLIAILETILGCSFFLYSITSANIIASSSYTNRTLNIFMPMIISCCICYIQLCGRSIPKNICKYCTPFLIVGTCIVVGISTTNYKQYLNKIVDITEHNDGYVVTTDCGILEFPYYWGWQISTESILAQAIYKKKNIEVDAIITQNKEHISWTPYDSYNIEEYPDLSRYGVHYNKEKLGVEYE